MEFQWLGNDFGMILNVSLRIKSLSYLYIENHTFTYSLIHLKVFVLPFSHFPSCVWDKINLSKVQKALIGTILWDNK